MSDAEKAMLQTEDDLGFETELFSGKPNWEKLRSIEPYSLKGIEKEFFDGPTDELCQMSDPWHIRQEAREIPSHVWDFALKNGFFGLRVSESYGGASFSFQAQSAIFGKIASHSLDVATLVSVQNSLGPEELIQHYGTQTQKEHFLHRFAEGKEVASFAVTSQQGGSDISSMEDQGYVTYGDYNGEKVKGVLLTWNKRYITFAPKATLLILGFHLRDPDNILSEDKKEGLTLALIPTDHPGVINNSKHMLGGAFFPNGPTSGENVFIPLEWIIGGTDGIGNGWPMITNSLFVGRAVSLPAISVATTKTMLRYSSAYARTRRQFGLPVSAFEGVEEPLARLVERAYVSESARQVSTSMIDSGKRPVAIASLMKYKTTEYARCSVNDAMDIHAGRGICDGPSNYLQAAYQMAPIGITVEGTNILTRSLITFTQGILSSHPYLQEELRGVQAKDEKEGFHIFETALLGHISFLFSNAVRSLLHRTTKGLFCRGPEETPGMPKCVTRWYKQLEQASCSFAFVADITAVFLGEGLKKKQRIGGRMSDALAELYFTACVLKRYEDDGFPQSDLPIVELCVEKSLQRFHEHTHKVVRNFPNRFIQIIFKIFISSQKERKGVAVDTLEHEAVSSMLKSDEVRDRLTNFIYIPSAQNDSLALLEVAFQKAKKAEPAYKKLRAAIRSGALSKSIGENWVERAKEKSVLTDEEIQIIVEAEQAGQSVTKVDQFKLEEK